MSKENTTDFTWKEFTSETNKGHMAVHCKTEKEAITFCSQMHGRNMKWIDEQNYLDCTEWTSYRSDYGIYYTNDGRYVTRNYYLDKEDIVFEFSDCFTGCDYIRAKQKKPLARVESATTKTVQEVKETKEVTKNLKIKERKEENIMKNNLAAIFGETVGKITDGMVAITFSGQVAIKRNEDEYVRFNAETNTIENQMDFVMKEAEDFLFLLPVAEVQNGDVIKKNNTYYQVVGVGKQNGLSVVNIKSGTKKTLIRETNIMGFNFYFKVVNLFGDMGSVATSGMNPMLLPMLLSDNGEDESILLPMLLCGGLGSLGGQQPQGAGMNPMMMALLMGDGKMDAKTLMMMSLFGQQQAPVVPTQITPVINNTQAASTTVVTVPPVE